jgi:ribonuclease T2
LLVLIALAVAATYLEQRSGDTGRDVLTSTSEPSRNVPANRMPERQAGTARGDQATGDFDYYTLVLSWSPTHCESPDARDDDVQCDRRDGRQYAFIVHGLWPQHKRGYPESCPTPTRPFVPDGVIGGMMDIMPGKGLIIHQYRKHGTCSGLSPDAYFQLTRRLFRSLTIPARFRNPGEAQFLSPSEVASEFASANPSLPRGSVTVSCGGPGSRLRDVRICFSKSGDAIACGANEAQGQLCRSNRVHVPPVR